MAFADKKKGNEYINNYARAKYDRLSINPAKDEGQAIRAAAAQAGQSVQAYILDAVRRRMGEGD
jgi:uncharacterized protein (DUF1778 family)